MALCLHNAHQHTPCLRPDKALYAPIYDLSLKKMTLYAPIYGLNLQNTYQHTSYVGACKSAFTPLIVHFDFLVSYKNLFLGQRTEFLLQKTGFLLQYNTIEK